MMRVVRTLTAADVASAMELSVAANWNQTEEDWQRVIRLSPRGCSCIEDAGKIVATATLVVYSVRLAWIGMVLTRPEYRGQGLARRLMEDAIASAQEQGIRTLMLDATDQGRPLYESLGFSPEHAVERWERKGKHDRGVLREPQRSLGLSRELFDQDECVFGVSREKVLEELAEAGELDITGCGYVLSRAGRSRRYLGPCVAESGDKARVLMAAHLDKFDTAEGWYWDLLPENQEAKRCAEELGFTRSRVLCRMRRGEALEQNVARMYAIAGFELG